MTPATEDVLYEFVDGERRELPPMGVFQSSLATLLSYFLNLYVMPRQLGQVMVEGLFVLQAEPKFQRKPDVAFVSKERWPGPLPRLEAWPVVPDLAVEIVSPTNTADDVLAKIHDYFRFGVKRVWVIYTEVSEVYVYESPTRIRVLQHADVLEEEPLLPGFRLPLADLFPAER